MLDVDCTSVLVKEEDSRELSVYHPVPLTEIMLTQLDPVLSTRPVTSLIFPTRNGSLKGLADWAALCPDAAIYATDKSVDAVKKRGGGEACRGSPR